MEYSWNGLKLKISSIKDPGIITTYTWRTFPTKGLKAQSKRIYIQKTCVWGIEVQGCYRGAKEFFNCVPTNGVRRHFIQHNNTQGVMNLETRVERIFFKK